MNRDQRLESAASLSNLGEDLLPRALSEHLVARPDIENRVLHALGTPGLIPVLVGDHGTGKSRLARRIAVRLHQGVGIPKNLHGLQVISLDPSTLLSEALYSNQLEHKIALLVKNACDKAVLLLDDIEIFVGAGSSSEHEDGDVLNLLRPLIKRHSGLRIMAATSSHGWAQVSQSRSGFASVCTTIPVPAMDEPETEALLLAQAVHFSQRSGFKVEPAVLDTALDLAPSLCAGACLPGSASGLLDRAFMQLRHDFVEDLSLRTLDQERFIRGVCSSMGLPRFLVDTDAALPKEDIRARLTAGVLGQPHAVDALADRIHLIQHRLCAPGRPKGVFLLSGPTGTGKTELAKQVASLLHDGRNDALHRFDMSEFATPDAAAAFIGMQRRNQHSRISLVDIALTSTYPVILLDEIEKAHPAVFDALLQVFGEGRLTDGKGRTGHFETATFLVTSNVGAVDSCIGFTEPTTFTGGSETAIPRAVSDFFRPEFVNRLTAVLRFQGLPKEVISSLAQREVKQLQGRPGIARRNLQLQLDPAALDYLMQIGYSREFGARPMQRMVEKLVGGALAAWMENNPRSRNASLVIGFDAASGMKIRCSAPATRARKILARPAVISLVA